MGYRGMPPACIATMTIEQLEDIAASFLGWQCRLRQYAVRRGDGRPTIGMRPNASIASGPELGAITTVLVKRDPLNDTAQFRYIVQQTHDPQLRFDAAIKMLQTEYYRAPREFSDAFAALFNLDSPSAARLLGAGQCQMNFKQANQRFSLPCTVEAVGEDDAFYQATYWHNAMFNPRLSGPVQVIKFAPDWQHALAETT